MQILSLLSQWISIYDAKIIIFRDHPSKMQYKANVRRMGLITPVSPSGFDFIYDFDDGEI